jgi:hypothetical protein
MKQNKKLHLIRLWLLAFVVLLFLSGLTAIPVDRELALLLQVFSAPGNLHSWLLRVNGAYKEVELVQPFLLYGYDWLAFAHFILAILFIGPFCDPIKNIWVLQFGLIACVLVFPWAFIAGSFRGIPLGWRLIDCSFGFFGFIFLWVCYSQAKKLSIGNNSAADKETSGFKPALKY